jgi:mono/diheme cytochrome c family protein
VSELAHRSLLSHSKPLALGLAFIVQLSLGCGPQEAPAPTGEILYLRHCASCHGESGKGDGPVAASLRTRPADLTTIAERAGGSFDDSRVMRSIDGRRAVAEHGTREMPVWGAVFTEDLEGQRNAAYTVLLHGRSLTDYIRSLQQKK